LISLVDVLLQLKNQGLAPSFFCFPPHLRICDSGAAENKKPRLFKRGFVSDVIAPGFNFL
jgi:hypothetical protein